MQNFITEISAKCSIQERASVQCSKWATARCG